MINGTTVIKAKDTASAMDEIIEKLGKDSYIIGTKKIGNEILEKSLRKLKILNRVNEFKKG